MNTHGERSIIDLPATAHTVAGNPAPLVPGAIAAQAYNLPLAEELETARKLQQSLLPKTFPAIQGISLAGFCHSAGQVGGDFYDVLRVSPDSLMVIVADVMGKGVPAALLAATLRALARTLPQANPEPAALLTRMNQVMFEDLSSLDMFITVQLARIDTAEQRFVLASAGHCPFLWTDATGRIEALAPEGLPLGIDGKSGYIQEERLLTDLRCGLLYSDGITEAVDADGELFGQERLEEWLKLASAGPHTHAEALAQSFRNELKHFEGGVPSRDDQTLLVIAGQPSDQKSLAFPAWPASQAA